MKKLFLIFFLISLIAIVGCSTQIEPQANDQVEETQEEVTQEMPTQEEADTPEMVVEETTDEPAAMQEESNVKVINIEAKKWGFVPSTITVNQGDQVKLLITSIDVDHGINLPAFGVNEQLKTGQTVEINFVADTAGTHSFFCNVFCGSGHGSMRGTLVVE
jgi:cytochrome c oxidase subunit II